MPSLASTVGPAQMAATYLPPSHARFTASSAAWQPKMLSTPPSPPGSTIISSAFWSISSTVQSAATVTPCAASMVFPPIPASFTSTPPRRRMSQGAIASTGSKPLPRMIYTIA